MSLTNLDPLTENYNIDYYMNYMMTWPSLFTVAEDQNGNIIGYSMPPSFLTIELEHHTANNYGISHGQSRRRPRLAPIHTPLLALAWACHSSHSRSAIQTIRPSSNIEQSAGARVREGECLVCGSFCKSGESDCCGVV
jgi:hypothetical protein